MSGIWLVFNIIGVCCFVLGGIILITPVKVLRRLFPKWDEWDKKCCSNKRIRKLIRLYLGQKRYDKMREEYCHIGISWID